MVDLVEKITCGLVKEKKSFVFFPLTHLRLKLSSKLYRSANIENIYAVSGGTLACMKPHTRRIIVISGHPHVATDVLSAFTTTVWCGRSVTDPRDGRKVALKKMPNVFQNLVSCKRVFRELRMLCFFKHDNVNASASFL